MLLVEIPWASRVWALPFLSALAPSERYAAKRGNPHKKITQWAWQLLLVLRRWYPKREIVATADRSYASLKLHSRCRSLSKPPWGCAVKATLSLRHLQTPRCDLSRGAEDFIHPSA